MFIDMRSAKQTSVTMLSNSYGPTEINANTVEGYRVAVPYAGWITDITVQLEVSDLSNDCAIALDVSPDVQYGVINNSSPLPVEIMDVWEGGDKASALMGTDVPLFFPLYGHTATDLPDGYQYSLTKKRSLNRVVEYGEEVVIDVYLNNLSNTLTTGTLDVTITFNYLVGALDTLNGSVNKTRNGPVNVAILANLDSSSVLFNWIPPSSGRLSNIRLTLSGPEANGHGPEDFLYFGRGNFAGENRAWATIQHLPDGVIISGANATSGAAGEYDFVLYRTAYSRKIFKVKAGEAMMIKYETATSGTGIARILIEFDFIPDYNAPVTFNFQGELLNIASSTVYSREFRVPYDMYLDDYMLNYRLNDDTIDAELFTLVHKNPYLGGHTVFVETGSLLSGSVLSAGSSYQLPSNIIDRKMIGSQVMSEDTSPKKPNMYIPAGSWIIVVMYVDAASGTEDFDFNFNLTGYNRVRSRNFGVNYFEGELVSL